MMKFLKISRCNSYSLLLYNPENMRYCSRLMEQSLVGVDSHSVSVAFRRKNQFRVLGCLGATSVNLSLHSKTFLRRASIAGGSAWWAGGAHGLLDGGFGRDTAEADLLRV